VESLWDEELALVREREWNSARLEVKIGHLFSSMKIYTTTCVRYDVVYDLNIIHLAYDFGQPLKLSVKSSCL
jgi:hypothetical protein